MNEDQAYALAHPLDRADLGVEAAQLDRGVARRALEELEAVGVVHGDREGDEPAEGMPDYRPCTWWLNGLDGEVIGGVFAEILGPDEQRCSEMWGAHTQPPPNKDQIEGTHIYPPHISEHLPAPGPKICNSSPGPLFGACDRCGSSPSRINSFGHRVCDGCAPRPVLARAERAS